MRPAFFTLLAGVNVVSIGLTAGTPRAWAVGLLVTAELVALLVVTHPRADDGMRDFQERRQALERALRRDVAGVRR